MQGGCPRLLQTFCPMCGAPCPVKHVCVYTSQSQAPYASQLPLRWIWHTSLLGFSRPPANPVAVGQLRGNGLVILPANNQLPHSMCVAYMRSEHSRVRAVVYIVVLLYLFRPRCRSTRHSPLYLSTLCAPGAVLWLFDL